MSNAIRFLESVGQESAFATGNPSAYASAVVALTIDGVQKRALLERDHAALASVLRARPNMICMVWAPDQEPLREDDDKQDGDAPVEEEAPSKD